MMPPAPFWEPPSAEQLRNMYEELGVTEASLRRDVAALTDWMDKQPHLPRIQRIDGMDRLLQGYLLRCKNSMERAKSSIELLFTWRTHVAELFHHRDPADRTVRETLKCMILNIMPRLTPEGYRVHIFAYTDLDPDFDVKSYFRTGLMMQELAVRDNVCKREILVLDLAQYTLKKLKAWTWRFNLMTTYVKSATRMYPTRLHRLHVVNAPNNIATILSMFKQTAWHKYIDRVVVHNGGADELRKHIPAECLPRDLGGTGPSMAEGNELWRRYLIENREWFKTQELLKTDESKREVKSAVVEELNLGIEGSFRTLSVD